MKKRVLSVCQTHFPLEIPILQTHLVLEEAVCGDTLDMTRTQSISKMYVLLFAGLDAGTKLASHAIAQLHSGA